MKPANEKENFLRWITVLAMVSALVDRRQHFDAWECAYGASLSVVVFASTALVLRLTFLKK